MRTGAPDSTRVYQLLVDRSFGTVKDRELEGGTVPSSVAPAASA
jgi:hypothetical protein